MTDAELLELAKKQVPAKLRASGQVIERFTPPAASPHGVADEDDAFVADMVQAMGTTPPPPMEPDPEAGDVAFHEDTPLGRRTIIVQVRKGKVVRRIGQA
jgi:hypothetical protein